MAKATALRQAEKEKNTATIEDGKVAQAATNQALTVLKEFYAKAAALTPASAEEKVGGPISYDKRALAILESAKGGAAMMQIPGAPEMEGGSYNGQESGGIVGMLEVIESDFARLISETSASETDSQNEFEEFSADSAQDKAVKEQDVKNKSAEKVEKETALQSTKKRHEGLAGGAGRCERVLGKTETVLRTSSRELRGARGQAQGGDRIAARGAQDPPAQLNVRRVWRFVIFSRPIFHWRMNCP